MVALSGSNPEQSEEGRAFLQRRAATFGLMGAGLGWFFLLFRLFQIIQRGDYHLCSRADFIFHFLAGLSLFMVWLVCRRGQRSARTIRAVEAIGLVGASVGYSVMGAALPAIARPDFIVLVATTYGLVARSIYVPSSARRTLALSIAVAIPPLIMTYFMVDAAELSKWKALVPEFADLDHTAVAVSSVLFNGAWWVCTTVLCTAASQVIYGLRREVRNVRRLGQYTIDSKLGQGGMGVVYSARHAMLRRPTAIKLINADKDGASNLARFEREVQLTAALTHPNTVTIFDYGRTPDGVFYYAMELLDGATLEELVAIDGPQAPARVIHILEQVCGALAEAHGVGLVHRDIKPANIMLVSQGGEPDVAKVLDFGLVKELREEGAPGASLTQTGVLAGTPHYMPPEAITDPAEQDGRSDLYALGAVGYFLLVGEPVFPGNSVVEVCGHHLHTDPERPSLRSEREIPADLEAVILACLAKDPGDRPQDAIALRTRLRACAAGASWCPIQSRSWWREHHDELRARHAEGEVAASEGTIEIDLARRRGARLPALELSAN